MAVISGHRVKSEMRDSNGALTGDGMATAGLVLGYAQLVLVVIPICVITVLALLGPSIGDIFSNIIDELTKP